MHACFISSDAGPLHIALAMGTPIVAVFGPSIPSCYGPFDNQSIALYKKPKCGPCNDCFRDYTRKCKEKTCIESITVEEVLSAAELILSRK